MKQLKNYSFAATDNDADRTTTLDEARNDITDSELMGDIMGKYGNMNEDELVGELIKAVDRAKEDGSFDVQSIKNFYSLVSPYLSEEKRSKLANLISAITTE